MSDDWPIKARCVNCGDEFDYDPMEPELFCCQECQFEDMEVMLKEKL